MPGTSADRVPSATSIRRRPRDSWTSNIHAKLLLHPFLEVLFEIPSGSRKADPNGLVRATVSWPLLKSASRLRVHSMYGSAPTT